LAYLASEGGYFVDADDKCLTRLDTVVSPQAEFVGYQDDYGAIGSNFIGTIPGHPVIALALENAGKAFNRGDRDIPWLSTGPGLLTRAFTQVLSVAETDWLSRVHLLELWELQRAVGIYSPARYKRANVVKTNSSGETKAAQLPTRWSLRATISKIEMSRK
jgi:mannosyltransferase OCH1-like enzyme